MRGRCTLRVRSSIALAFLAIAGCASGTPREGGMRYRVTGVIRSIDGGKLAIDTAHAGLMAFRIGEQTTYLSLDDGNVVQQTPERGSRVVVVATGEGDAATARAVHFSPSAASSPKSQSSDVANP